MSDSKTPAPNFYESLSTSYPEFMKAMEGLGSAVRTCGPLDERTVHLVQLAAAAASRSEGAVHSHTRRALAAGVAPEAIRHALIAITSTVGFPTVVASLTWAEDQIRKQRPG